MPTDLRADYNQRTPSTSPHQEAFVSLARTEAALHDDLDRVLGPRGLSLTQYNVLRILRGAGSNGLCRNEIAQRLITRMPDVTRLLDRMEAAGLVSRIRSTEDRRLVNTTLTQRGRALVDDLDPDVDRMHREQLGHLADAELRTLIDLLERARNKS
jgi:DNA-binding MarR family transcriptional regulator